MLISAPATDEDLTVVLGVNDERYDPEQHRIISNASCTTNGLAPVVKVLWDSFGISKGVMTTIHAYTNSQQVLDVAGPKGAADRELRAGAMNIIPTSTGAARAVALVLPEVKGIVDGLAYRVPTPTVSIVEFIAMVERATAVDEVNARSARCCRWSDGGRARRDRRTAGFDGPQGQHALVHRRPRS